MEVSHKDVYFQSSSGSKVHLIKRYKVLLVILSIIVILIVAGNIAIKNV